MPPNSLTRTVVVDALDDLGERSRVSYAERTSWDEPYPPSFVADQLEDLRWDVWWTRRLLFGIWAIATLALSVGTGLGLSRSILVPAILFLVLPQFGPVLTLIRKGKAEELYALLLQIDETTESTASSPVSEAA